MKKLSIILIVLAFALFAAGCKDSKSDKIKIGISKIVSHPALDSVEKGIQDQLKEDRKSVV